MIKDYDYCGHCDFPLDAEVRANDHCPSCKRNVTSLYEDAQERDEGAQKAVAEAEKEERKMDKVDEVLLTGGINSPLFSGLSISERRQLHYRMEKEAGRIRSGVARGSGGLLDPALTEALRIREAERAAGAYAIRLRWRRDANR